MNPHLYGQFTYNKGGKKYSGEKTAPSIRGVGNTGQPHARESNWTTFSRHIQK